MQRSRFGITLLLLASILLVGVARNFASAQQHALVGAARSGNRLSSLNSFTLGLVLGGLRGPLVMILWVNSENQKANRDLEDVNTEIELIRLLQPEFDSVHIFQIWNKAYNVSAQMANVPNKYAAILDAIRYGRAVDRDRPDNINIEQAIGDLYAQKLGNSAEKGYYTQQLRHDTRARPGGTSADKRGIVNHHEPLLDDAGHILPEFLVPTHERPADLPAAAEWNDGSDLQYLKQFDSPDWGGFPYGVPPYALGYNYLKRAQVLGSDVRVKDGKVVYGREGTIFRYGQRHAQLSESVIDSRPAVTLKSWCEQEAEEGQRLEMEIFGLPVGEADRGQIERSTAQLTAANLRNKSGIEHALFCYDRAVRLAGLSLTEYARHIASGYAANVETYDSHQDALRAGRAMAIADAAYLRAITTNDPAERGRQYEIARASYVDAMQANLLEILRYYTEDHVVDVVYPNVWKDRHGIMRHEKLTKRNVSDMDPAAYQKLNAAVEYFLRTHPNAQGIVEDLHASDRADFSDAISRSQLRLNVIQAATHVGPSSRNALPEFLPASIHGRAAPLVSIFATLTTSCLP